MRNAREFTWVKQEYQPDKKNDNSPFHLKRMNWNITLPHRTCIKKGPRLVWGLLWSLLFKYLIILGNNSCDVLKRGLRIREQRRLKPACAFAQSDQSICGSQVFCMSRETFTHKDEVPGCYAKTKRKGKYVGFLIVSFVYPSKKNRLFYLIQRETIKKQRRVWK